MTPYTHEVSKQFIRDLVWFLAFVIALSFGVGYMIGRGCGSP